MARTIYKRCIYGIFGREITKYTVIYGVFIQCWPTVRVHGVIVRFWPTLNMNVHEDWLRAYKYSRDVNPGAHDFGGQDQ